MLMTRRAVRPFPLNSTRGLYLQDMSLFPPTGFHNLNVSAFLSQNNKS